MPFAPTRVFPAVIKHFCAALLFCYSAAPPVTLAQELTLPHYQMTIDPEDLEYLNENPWTTTTFPAQITYDGILYNCQVRYRGSTARELPKKSWKIFWDDGGPFARDEINLNAEWRDLSLCRNVLAMETARFIGMDAPDVRFVSLSVNGAYYGVHVEVEQVDRDFFTLRGRTTEALFKCACHGSRFGQPVNYERLPVYYEPKIASQADFDTLGARISFIQHAQGDELEIGLPRIIDVENVMKYFTVQFCINNHDGHTKNFYLHLATDGYYRLVPWDGDSSFGNDWQGNYDGLEDWVSQGILSQQALFQAVIVFENNRQQLNQIIHTIASAGYDTLLALLPRYYNEIRNDIYQDTLKRATNQEFEAELDRLLGFLTARRPYIEDLDWVHPIEILESHVESAYLSSPDVPIRMEVRLDRAVDRATAILVNNVSEGTWIPLYDNGTNGDEQAGDLVYTREFLLEVTGLQAPVFYVFDASIYNNEGSFMQPRSGYLMNPHIPLTIPGIRIDPNPPVYGDLMIGPFLRSGAAGAHVTGVRNASTHPLNLSSCVIRLGSNYKMLQFCELEPLPPGDTLWVTNRADWLEDLEPAVMSTGHFYFRPEIGDSVFLETSTGDRLTETIVEAVGSYLDDSGPIIINEINYNSSEDFDTEDWIELYAVSGSYNLEQWYLSDEEDEHVYRFPAGTSLSEGEYLVIARDIEEFSEHFPGVSSVIGDFDFGFGSGSDEVRLFNAGGQLVDWVSYDDEDPWPTEPDGDGPTLELINPTLSNFDADFWRASEEPDLHGTPGRQNSVYLKSAEPGEIVVPDNWRLESIYPNPFNSTARIRFAAPHAGRISLAVYDILGRTVKTFDEFVGQPGQHEILWNGLSTGGIQAATGIYFFALQAEDVRVVKKAVLLR